MTVPAGPVDENAAPSPEESMAVIGATLREARRALGFSDAPLYLVWGAALVLLLGRSSW